MKKALLLAATLLGMGALEAKDDTPPPEEPKPDPIPPPEPTGKIHRYLCAICKAELRTPEVIPKDQVAVCHGCFASVQAAEKYRADRKARKLAAWDARQPK